jgi:hypothetical protein
MILTGGILLGSSVLKESIQITVIITDRFMGEVTEFDEYVQHKYSVAFRAVPQAHRLMHCLRQTERE